MGRRVMRKVLFHCPRCGGRWECHANTKFCKCGGRLVRGEGLPITAEGVLWHFDRFLLQYGQVNDNLRAVWDRCTQELVKRGVIDGQQLQWLKEIIADGTKAPRTDD